MRLYKFLVISNKLMYTTSKLGEEVFLRRNREIKIKNKLYKFKDNTRIGLMKLEYPNECREFKEENSAYIVIDTDKYSDIVKLISPLENELSKEEFKRCNIESKKRCGKLICQNKNICMDIDFKNSEKPVGGRTWSFVHDTKGTRNKTYDIYDQMIDENGYKFAKEITIEPRTGGIAYSSLKWVNGTRPNELSKSVYMPLQHWIKCMSIPVTVYKEGDKKKLKKINSYYHVGHIFDYRSELINLATYEEQMNIRKKVEPKANIYRGKRVLGGEYDFSDKLNCTCIEENGSKLVCKECTGVLYINTEQKLTELYNQLISDDYKNLINIHIN